MLEQGAGAIVNIASVNSFFEPDAATIDYGAAKAAVVNLSKSLSQEFGPRGIRVNCVSPGQVSTDLWLGKHGVAETFAKPRASTQTRSAKRPLRRPPQADSLRPRRSPRSSRCSPLSGSPT
jgi:NAD(P)-dependent dehydrogenase (short-subunit alcohol dehydrogenase family)